MVSAGLIPCSEHIPAASKYFTSSRWPSWAASIKGVEQPSSISAPALIRKSATSEKPPQHARVRAVSCVSSVCALIFAPGEQKSEPSLSWPRSGSLGVWALFCGYSRASCTGHQRAFWAPNPRALTLCQQQGHHFFVAFPSSFHQRSVTLIIDLLQVGSSLDQQRCQLHVPTAGGQGERGFEGIRWHVHLGTAVQQQPCHLYVAILQAKGSPGVRTESPDAVLATIITLKMILQRQGLFTYCRVLV